MNNKGNMILLTIIATSTLLVSVVGMTFAYFSATIQNGESSQGVKTGNVSGEGVLVVTYDTNGDISSNNAVNNQVIASKTITLTGSIPKSANLKYALEMNVVQNDYESNELVYTITSKNVSDNGSLIPSTTSEIGIPAGKSIVDLGSGSFAGPSTSGVKHSYTLTVKYVGPNTEGTNKVFKANFGTGQN